ncbi:hypothetical protein AB1Y20_021340 [Prymnesium parvum]|uniref:Protein kinase domain-containing protein n=1 Tax=Prymnesium parvum TaxID=97485 RepID=A0AB34JI01_PRYPA
MRTASIPGLCILHGDDVKEWTASDVKRRHFVVDGCTLKLFGRRGKTYKGQLNLLAVSALRPASDPTAPTGALEIQIRTSRSRCQTASGRLAKEIRLLKLLNHPNVIRLYEVLHTPTDILMVMELVDGGDLLEVLNTQRRRFSEGEVRNIFGQVCCGVSFCHSLGVAHRDLKPENILLKRHADGSITIKVADFGLSTLMQTGHMLSTACGSPHYVAPEILNFNGEARYDGRESDVWSLGVILHVLLIYKLPFEAESTQLLYKKIRQGLPSLPEHISPTSEELLRGMLEVVPDKRMTLVQAWVVRHKWLQMDRTVPQLSQLVDAVVDIPQNWLVDGSADFISASKIFQPKASEIPAQERVRRAFTFDTLPRSFSDVDDKRYAAGTKGSAVPRVGRNKPRTGNGSPTRSPRLSETDSNSRVLTGSRTEEMNGVESVSVVPHVPLKDDATSECAA